MKKTLCLSLILTLAFFLGSNKAFAVNGGNFRGTFEAPLIDVAAQAEVPGSEGKLNTNGDYKVEIEIEIEPETPTDYEVCINDINNMPLFLENYTIDEDGEIKAEGNVLIMYVINYLQAPSFQVRTGAPGTCDGDLVYESGLGLMIGEPEDVGPPEGKGPPEGVGPR